MKLAENEEQLRVVKRGFPKNLAKDVYETSRLILIGDDRPFIGDFIEVYIQGKIMHVPYRVCFPEPSDLIFSNLDHRLSAVIHCI